MKYKDLEEAKTIGYEAYHLVLEFGFMKKFELIEAYMQRVHALQSNGTELYSEVRYIGGPNYDPFNQLSPEASKVIFTSDNI